MDVTEKKSYDPGEDLLKNPTETGRRWGTNLQKLDIISGKAWRRKQKNAWVRKRLASRGRGGTLLYNEVGKERQGACEVFRIRVSLGKKLKNGFRIFPASQRTMGERDDITPRSALIPVRRRVWGEGRASYLGSDSPNRLGVTMGRHKGRPEFTKEEGERDAGEK